MKIQDQDRYHGPALMQIVEHSSFTALNKVDKKYGHYQVNANTFLWMKYATADSGPWQFTFQPSDVLGIKDDLKRKGVKIFGVLVCGHETICCLTHDELTRLLDLDSTGTQWIRVEAPPRRQMRVTNARHGQDILVPHSRYPAGVF